MVLPVISIFRNRKSKIECITQQQHHTTTTIWSLNGYCIVRAAIVTSYNFKPKQPLSQQHQPHSQQRPTNPITYLCKSKRATYLLESRLPLPEEHTKPTTPNQPANIGVSQCSPQPSYLANPFCASISNHPARYINLFEQINLTTNLRQWKTTAMMRTTTTTI